MTNQPNPQEPVAVTQASDKVFVALATASATFHRYAKLHEAKGTDEGKAKADANYEMAVQMDEALATTRIAHAPSQHSELADIVKQARADYDLLHVAGMASAHWIERHAMKLMNLAEQTSPDKTRIDAMAERAARAVLRRNFPSLSDADIDEMWGDHAGDMKAALTAALQENGK